jgi:hypothetical protein
MLETLFVIGAMGATILGIVVLRRMRVKRIHGTGNSAYSGGWWVAGHGAIGDSGSGGSDGAAGGDSSGGGGNSSD